MAPDTGGSDMGLYSQPLVPFAEMLWRLVCEMVAGSYVPFPILPKLALLGLCVPAFGSDGIALCLSGHRSQPEEVRFE